MSESGTPEAILSAAMVAIIRDRRDVDTIDSLDANIARLAASHETLRRLVERLTAERDAANGARIGEYRARRAAEVMADELALDKTALLARVAELTEALRAIAEGTFNVGTQNTGNARDYARAVLDEGKT